MADFYDFNSTFWLSLTTMVFGFGGACLAYSLRSKCSHIKLCYGCVDVTRDIDAEVELEEAGLTPISPSLEQPIATNPPASRISFSRSMLADETLPMRRVTPPISRKGSMLSFEIQKEIQKELSNNNV